MVLQHKPLQNRPLTVSVLAPTLPARTACISLGGRSFMSLAVSAPRLTVAPRELARFDATLERLRQLNHTAFLRYALDVGDHMLDAWYGGEIRIYRDRKSAEHLVFEALLRERRDQLGDLGLTPQTLRNYLLAACTWRELPPEVREPLDLTHLPTGCGSDG